MNKNTSVRDTKAKYELLCPVISSCAVNTVMCTSTRSHSYMLIVNTWLGYHGYTECVSQRGCGCGELESGSWDTDEVCFPIAERSPDM